MKTVTIRKISSSSRIHPNTDAQRQADFDDLVWRATHGDRRALGAIAIVISPALLEEARQVLGEFAQEAGDVLQDFFVVMLEGRSRFVPAHGRALAWMCGIIRAMAWQHRAECERRWNQEEEDP
jgi:DNA-directed RNA polymerase specialized sigma24 family protein